MNARLAFGQSLGQGIGAAASGGLGVANAAGNTGGIGAAVAGLNAARGQTTTENKSTSGGFFGTLFGSGGLGGFLGGAGGLVSGLFPTGISSKIAKTDKTPLDFDAVLARVDALPVEAGRYKPEIGDEGRAHIGPYAEDFRRAFGVGDGKTINIGDALGVALAAVKGLKRKVDELEGFAFVRAA